MVSYLGAFPFGEEAPVVLGLEQMIMVVVIMTQRYERVLKKGDQDRTKLLFRSLAVFDRQESGGGVKPDRPGHRRKSSAAEESLSKILHGHSAGFAIDDAIDDEDDEDDDGLALAALEALDAIEVFKHGDAPLNQSSIPPDNLRKLIMYLLLIAPLGVNENPSKYADRLLGDNLAGLRRIAESVLAAFINDIEKQSGAKYHQFASAITNSLPFLFAGFNPLFEHFLFSKDLDLTKRKGSASAIASKTAEAIPIDPPILQHEGDILDLNVLSQLSFFIPGSALFRRLRLLYSGNDAGFSLGSFESKVLNWRAPTILLVTGNRISDPPTSGSERAFSDTLPPKRFPDSSKSSRVVLGIYMSQPWKQTHRDCIGDSETLLFQLEPVHEVFRASTLNTDYVSFTKPPTSHAGIFVGCPHPKPKATAGLSSLVQLGPVSLYLDGSFEFGVFTHNYSAGGGAFHASTTRKFDFQDRFEIESLEVWGCGGSEEAEEQRKRWAWEEREAEARRRINLGSGDIEADRALLEMAGIIGGSRSGGSLG